MHHFCYESNIYNPSSIYNHPISFVYDFLKLDFTELNCLGDAALRLVAVTGTQNKALKKYSEVNQGKIILTNIKVFLINIKILLHEITNNTLFTTKKYFDDSFLKKHLLIYFNTILKISESSSTYSRAPQRGPIERLDCGPWGRAAWWVSCAGDGSHDNPTPNKFITSCVFGEFNFF